jgi:hypothetical protein
MIDKNKHTFYGTIKNFLMIENEMFCIVNLYDINDKKTIKNLIAPAAKYYKKFYKSILVTNELVLIKPEQIVRRCLLISNNKHTLLTPCVEIEHD